MKLVDALAIGFHHIKGGGRRDCPAIVPTYADRGRRPPPHAGASVSAPTDGRACSEPQDQFLGRFDPHTPKVHAALRAGRRRRGRRQPRRSPLPAPAASTARSIARSPRRASRARPSRTPTTGASPTGSPRTSTRVWVPEKNLYGSGNSSVGRIYHNSLLLTTHAVAALTGHQGPCRNDERARALARRLCDSPPWSERDASPEGDPQFHNPGWVESMGTREAAMDKSIDPKVAEALMYAWRARDVLRLPARDRRPDRRPSEPLRARAVLPLPERAPEPAQLELRAVRARTPPSRAIPSCS